MSGISAGIGLISGINTAELINQLMALEARPIGNLQARIDKVDVKRAAFLALSAQLLAIQNAVANFDKISFFKRFNASSTNESVLTAIAGENAIPGSATFRVHSLVTNHSVVSRGLADADRTAIGMGTLTIEIGNGWVDRGTDLDELNGGEGVRRGVIAITDRSGATARIDLSMAFTLDDVLQAINSDTAIQVEAGVTGIASNGAQGDRIVIRDLSGGTGNLVVADVSGGSTAADLGIAVNVAADRIDGANLIRLDSSTLLASLNDGNGIARLRQSASGDDLLFSTSYGDFGVSLTDVLRLDTDLRAVNDGNGVRLGVIRITDRAGQSAEIDLTEAKTIRDVVEAIDAADVAVNVTAVNSRLLITDVSEAPDETAGPLEIEDVSGFAAADLGIAAQIEDDAVNGRDIYRMVTMGDLIRAINYAPGNESLVEASISQDGKGITLRALGFDNTVTVSAGQDTSGLISETGRDLGLLDATFTTNESFTSRPLIGGLNTVLLRSLSGGNGVQVGEVSFTDGLNQTTTIDFTTARTLQDVIDLINANAANSLVASVNSAGNGIVLRDESGGSSAVLISDVTGTLAADLNIAGTFDTTGGAGIESGNLQMQYISRQTELSGLNAGTGVTEGTFRITDSAGAAYYVNIGSDVSTIGDVLDRINLATPDTIEARVNDTGDGIVLIDTAGGDSALEIEDQHGGRAAADLRLAGTAGAGQNSIDGSFEIRIDVGPSDTLNEVARKLNEAGIGFAASVINDGGDVNPYSLTITSTVAGRRGELMIDSAGLDLGLDTLTRAQDAVVSMGVEGSAGSFLMTSSSNTLEDVMPGVTIDLLSASDEDVTITTAQDIDGIVESVSAFVDAYNGLQGAIDKHSSFDSETFERGPLLGDSTLDLIRTRLRRVVMQSFEETGGPVSRLFSVGLRLVGDNRLEFDEQKFREAYEESPKDVEQLFTTDDNGFGAVIQETLDELTRDFDGVLARKNDLLIDQQDLLNGRIDRLNDLLDAKRRRLEIQFASLESSLAALQGQQNALLSLVSSATG